MTILSRKHLSLLLLILAALPAAAAQSSKRRAVSFAMISVTGKVIDKDTGNPVISAEVVNGPRSSLTNGQGKYSLLVPVGLSSVVSVGRSGYEASQVQVVGKDNLTIDFTLKSKPTIKVRLKDGSSLDADFEASQFAIENVFANPSRSDNVNLCKADGTKVTANISEFAKITGPGVLVTDSACCTATQVLKVTTDMKNGEHADVVLADSCTGVFIDFAARNHLTALFIYTRFEDIQEIDFP